MNELPLLEACPTCRLAVQGGAGPGGRAWHDCTAVLELRQRVEAAAEVTTDDDLAVALKATIKRRADDFSAKDLAMLLESLRRTLPQEDDAPARPGARKSVSGSLLAFVREED